MGDFIDSGDGGADSVADSGVDSGSEGTAVPVTDAGDGGRSNWLDDGSGSDGADSGHASNHGGVNWLDSLPDGATLYDEDRAAAQGLAEHMQAKGLGPAAFQEALSWYNSVLDAGQEYNEGRDHDDKAAATGALQADWGSSYNTRIGAIREMISGAPFAEEILNARLADGSALFNSPDVLRWLDGIVGTSNRPAVTSSRGVGSPTDERAQIEEFMRTNYSGYVKDEGMQSRYRQLIEGDMSSKPAGKTSGNQNAAELAKISRMMGNPRSAYWKGPRSAALQARYRELVGG